jgi:molecular chaperone DnaK
MGNIIGIDLGIWNSCVCVMDKDQIVIIENDEGRRKTPSMVAFLENGDVKVGDPAHRQQFTNSQNTIINVKRLIGKKFAQVNADISHLKYKVLESGNGGIRIEAKGKQYSPEKITALILQAMKTIAEDFLVKDIREAVITVPNYFDKDQQSATIEAAKMSGLATPYLLDDVSAALVAHGLDNVSKPITVAVLILNGATFNVNIVEIDKRNLIVKSQVTDLYFGGIDFDKEIMSWVIRRFRNETGIDLRSDSMAIQRIMDAAERAKKELSKITETEISLPYITVFDDIPKHLVLKLTRANFESLCEDLFQRLSNYCLDSLKQAYINSSQIDEVVLVGGAAYIPKVQDIVKREFEKLPKKKIDLDEVLGIGAAISGSSTFRALKKNFLTDNVTHQPSRKVQVGKKNIFFSYASADFQDASKMVQDILKAGGNVWFDKFDISPGSNWDDEIENALNDSDFLLLLLTPDSVVSNNVKNEINFAVDNQIKIIPLLYKQCRKPLRLSRFQHIDFVSSYEAGLNQLVRILKLKATDNETS